ncbi:MAG: two-component system, sensor histidine kinase and response regulator [Desulfovibrionales bacterium]|nr:two-component system, sensor histidine kinase and response regulator [Desulfovibrionales bacterium]
MKKFDWLSIDISSFLCTVILLLALSIAGLFFMYRMDVSALNHSIMLKEKLHNDLSTEIINVKLEELFVDIKLMAGQSEVINFLEERDEHDRRNIEHEFIDLCNISTMYDQVRILNIQGMEIIRVNYNDGHPAAVPMRQLQDKSNRYYYKESIKLGPEEIYVSPFDLNIENGEIETPLKPMIRVGMALYNSAGEKLGVIILNYLGKRILDRIVQDAEAGEQYMLLNMDGYWLLSPDKSQEWAFMYSAGKSISFAALHPEAWSTIKAEPTGQFSTSEGVYTFSTIEVAPDDGTKSAVDVRKWKSVCLMPQAAITAMIVPIRATYLSIFGGMLLIILFGAFTRARLVRSRKLSTILLEKARLEAEDANRAKSDFLARMSHEIRTPMNAIIGLTHLALKTELSPKQLDYLKKVHLSAQSLLGIINDVLDFSKIEADRLDIESADFILDDVLNNIANMLGMQADKKGLEFLMMVESNAPNFLVGDSLRLGQVLLNITGNAIKFTESGEVLFCAELVEKKDRQAVIRFSVQDTGIGIAKEQIDNLFEPFNQADVSITRKYGGTGLGLAISKRLVEMMGGSMTVESEPGVGSTFICTIPFGLQDGQTDAYQVYPPELQGMRVLIVDDNKMAGAILSKTLASFAFDVEIATNGGQALQMILENETKAPYRLVITDWRAPGMGGLELTRKIKAVALKTTPKIILLTSYGNEEILHQAQQTGLDGVILKPFNRSLLFDTIMDIFGGEENRARRAERAKKLSGVPANVSGARVLLAEDNEINQQVAREILEGAGVAVNIAGNGREALKMLENGAYDVVLMDIQMPEMNGFEAAQAIRSTPALMSIPIIAMTAHALVGDKEKSLLAGMNDHVTKPIDPDLLMKTLSTWLPKQEDEAESVAPLDAKLGESAADFPHLPGIDVEKGLARVLGNEFLYKKLLTNFAHDCGESSSRLVALALSGQYAEASSIAHSLKGVAGNVGAATLHQLLSQIEAALQRKEAPPQELINAFESERNVVVGRVTQIFGPPVCKERDDRPILYENLQSVRPRLEELTVLLEQHDMEAISLVDSMGRILEDSATGLASDLNSALSKYDFAEALGKLEAFLQQWREREESDG